MARGRKTGGRPKGQANKVTRDLRALIHELLVNTYPRVQGWIDSVAEKNPARAAELVAKFSEYDIPKQAAMSANVTGDVHITVRTL